ncbi:aspartate/glutamate racemase family protein [bacterium]|nr:aspartate/glutamate racemase family protein [bacterium]
MIVRGGATTYGEDVGILMLDTRFPRLRGDIGNAKTFGFPVSYLRVRGASPARVVKEGDPSLLEPFVEGARELERRGCRAIATSCGFLALFQEALAASVGVPVFTSSLLQIPLLSRICGAGGKIGVMTARAASLTERHFAQSGAAGVPRAVAGMEGCPEFSKVFLEEEGPEASLSMDADRVRAELAAVAAKLVAENPDVRAVVLECTNMPPFRGAIQEACGRPVYDIVTLVEYVHSGLCLS